MTVKLTDELLAAGDRAEALGRLGIGLSQSWAEAARRELESLAFLLRSAADAVPAPASSKEEGE